MKRIFFIVAMLLLLFSCKGATVSESNQQTRFIIIHQEYNDARGSFTAIYQDRSTGKQYLFIKDGYGGGLTQL